MNYSVGSVISFHPATRYTIATIEGQGLLEDAEIIGYAVVVTKAMSSRLTDTELQLVVADPNSGLPITEHDLAAVYGEGVHVTRRQG